MRLLGLAAFLFVGCVPAQAVIDENVDSDDPSTIDTGDVDTGDDPADTGNDDTGSTDTGNDDQPDLSAWNGTRVFSFADVYGQGPCEETIVETGVNVTANPEYADAVAACGDCDEVFYVEAGVRRGDNQDLDDHMCREQTGNQGFQIAPEVVRGIEFNGDDVVIYTLREGWGGWTAEELAGGSLDGTDVSYEYDGNIYASDFHVEGSIEF